MAAVIRTFQINLGNTYPANVHQTSLRIINAIEDGEFRISGDGLVRGDFIHGNIIINYPDPVSIIPFIADVTVEFYNETDNTGDLKRRPLAIYPLDTELKTRAEA